MELDRVALGHRLREVREARRVSQGEACAAIAGSQPTYARIEAGERALKGAELVQLADLFAVRATAITGMPQVRARARVAPTGGTAAPMDAPRERLYAYLELDAYLTDQGIARAASNS